MNLSSKLWPFIVVAGIAAAAGIAGSLLWHRAADQALLTGTRLAPSRELADFTLIDTQGRNFTRQNLTGRWSVMFFGYTNCPDFCPTTLATLAALEQRLRAQHAQVLPQVIFVSVDARRDTPAQLAGYVPYFDPSFIGLTAADQPGIEQVARQFGVAVVITPTRDGNYTVDHSGALFVVDPQGKLAAILTGPLRVDTLAADWQRLVAG